MSQPTGESTKDAKFKRALDSVTELGSVFADVILQTFTSGATSPWLTPDEKQTAHETLCPTDFKFDEEHRENYKVFHNSVYDTLRNAFDDEKTITLEYTKAWAQSELKSCPGDWGMGFNRIAEEIIKTAAPIYPQYISLAEATAANLLLEYRDSAIKLADTIVGILGLPVPMGQSCRDYDYRDLVTSHYDSPAMEDAFCQALLLLNPAWPAMALPPTHIRTNYNKRDGDFCRPRRYVAKAVVLHLVRKDESGGLVFPSSRDLGLFIRASVVPSKSCLVAVVGQ